MSNDYSNIGFAISSREEVQPFVDRALREGHRTQTAAGTYVAWAAGAGARSGWC